MTGGQVKICQPHKYHMKDSHKYNTCYLFNLLIIIRKFTLILLYYPFQLFIQKDIKAEKYYFQHLDIIKKNKATF